jgi:ABC-type sugar transport system ATPase subunit
MAGRDVALERGAPAVPGQVVLEACGLAGRGFRDVSFALRRGEVLGWFGLVGAGRSEVARAIFGIDPVHAGNVWMGGEPVSLAGVWDAIARGIGLVPEDRKLQGLILKMAVAPNATLASLDKLSSLGAISGAREDEVVRNYIGRLNIRCTGSRQPVEQLSGGNQQKVVLARWLETRPRVLILDEPTKGVDVAAKSEIQGIVRELARAGTGVILISSELEEVRQMADRTLVFRGGRVTGEFRAGEASDAQLMSVATS